MKIAIINGPNLNLIGVREKNIYGDQYMDQCLQALISKYPQVQFSFFQSNIEGELINELQQKGFEYDGIVLNPGGYTHTSVAIGDAVAAIPACVIEVHISNIMGREEFRKISHVSSKVQGVISGLGLLGYDLAVQYIISRLP